MKKAIFALLTALLPALAWSQADPNQMATGNAEAKKWKFSGVGVLLGARGDQYPRLEGPTLGSMTDIWAIQTIDVSPYEKEPATMYPGGYLGIFAEWKLHRPSPKARRLNHRLRLGILNRDDFMEVWYGAPGSYFFADLGYRMNGRELALSADYLAEITGRRFYAYGGLGLGGGIFDKNILLVEMQDRHLYYYTLFPWNGVCRASGMAGIGVRFLKRMHLSLEYQRGIGLRLMKAPSLTTAYLRSAGLHFALRCDFLK
jgi:hypothetical protein